MALKTSISVLEYYKWIYHISRIPIEYVIFSLIREYSILITSSGGLRISHEGGANFFFRSGEQIHHLRDKKNKTKIR